MPQIMIQVDESGRTQWSTDGIEGLDALGKICETLFDMYEYFVKGELRPVMHSQPARVCIESDGEKLAVAYRPENDSTLALGMMSAALCGLYHEVTKEDFDPMVALLGSIGIPVEIK